MDNTTDLQEYLAVSKRAAASLLPPRAVDAFGCDRDDYAIQFALKATEAKEHFIERYGFSTPAENRYVKMSVWNQARDVKRKQALHGRSFVDVEEPEAAYHTEAQLEARDLIRRLEARLAENDWKILVHVGMAGGVIRHGWDEGRDGCSLDMFRRRVQKARARAKRILRTES